MSYFEVGAQPGRDGNQADLPLGMTVALHDDYSFADDGLVTVPEGLTVVGDTDPDRPARADAWEGISLEIGHTDASRTLTYLRSTGRSPVGHTA